MEAALNVLQHHDVGQGPVDRDRLEQLEATIKAGSDTFVKVGLALAEIRDSRLYRLTHTTFEAYCRERWDISRPRAYQLIGSAEVASTLMSTAVDTVPQERVLRPLIPLSAENRREVWAEAQRIAGDDQIVGARHVETAKLKVLPSKSPSNTAITTTSVTTTAKGHTAVRHPVHYKSRRVNFNDVMDRAVQQLGGIRLALNDMDVEALDRSKCPEWANAIDEVVGFMRSLRRELLIRANAGSERPERLTDTYVYDGITYAVGDTLPNGRRIESIDYGIPTTVQP